MTTFKPSSGKSVEVEECKSLLASIPFEIVLRDFPIQIKRWSIYDNMKHLLLPPTLKPADKSCRQHDVTDMSGAFVACVPSSIKLVSRMPWFCSSSPQCSKRETDIGHVCYHCGAKEK